MTPRLVLLALTLSFAPAALAQKTPPKATEAPATATRAEAPPAALGAWDYVIVMPGQEVTGRLAVQTATAGYKGSISADGERVFTALTVDGPALRATFEQPGFGTAEIAATVGADGTLAGTVSAGGGSFPLTATRTDG